MDSAISVDSGRQYTHTQVPRILQETKNKNKSKKGGKVLGPSGDAKKLVFWKNENYKNKKRREIIKQ